MRRGRTLGFGSARLLLPLPRSGYAPLLPSGNPERQDAPCAPRSYGDGGWDGGGVRRLSVGDGVGVGEGVGVAAGVGEGSTDGEGVGVASAEGLGLALGVSLGLGEGSGVAAGVGGAVGAGVGSGAGVAETPGVGRGVAGFVAGAAVGTAEAGVSVGVATGARVARATGWNAGSCATTWEAANTNAPPSSATVMIVTIRVPVVRIAPRRTWDRRSESHEPCVLRRRRSSKAASRMRSSRSGVGRGVGSEPSRPRTRVLPPISAAHAAHPLTWAARRAASAVRAHRAGTHR